MWFFVMIVKQLDFMVENDAIKMMQQIQDNPAMVLSEYAKQVSIAFAEWILKSQFEVNSDNGKDWWYNFYEDKDATSAELFEIFLSQYKP